MKSQSEFFGHMFKLSDELEACLQMLFCASLTLLTILYLVYPYSQGGGEERGEEGRV